MGKLSVPQVPEFEKACQFTCSDDSHEDWPERKLASLAFRLAILEKAATTIGALSFVWATVVLLGGFASALLWIDFWFVTVVLVVEGARIFGRSQELEWERHILTTDARNSSSLRAFLWSVFSVFKVRRKRGGRASSAITAVPSSSSSNSDGTPQFDPRHSNWGSVSSSWHPLEREAHRSGRSFSYFSFPRRRASMARNISGLLYCLQVLSAASCIALSSSRLVTQSYGDADGGDSTSRRNLKAALNIFYSLAFVEATVSLVHKGYFETAVSGLGLLEKVNRQCGFCVHGVVCVNHFFYHIYSRSVKGTIFDACQADLASYAMEQVVGPLPYQQLTGLRILRKFATGEDLHRKKWALRKLGNNSAVIERLIEMLAWGKPEEEEIRRCAAEVVSQLACRRQNALRVSSIAGSMETISSLLFSFGHGDAADGIDSSRSHLRYYDPMALSLLGLRILKRLARDHDNCGKIGNTRGLLARIISLTAASKELFDSGAYDDPITLHGRLKAVKRPLALLKNLTGAAGQTGRLLRREISEIVFTFAKLRAILQHGKDYPQLQKSAVEVLLNLAMDEEAREKIGDTGGVIDELVVLFFDRRLVEAGGALAMLSLESRNNCGKILRLGVASRLVGAVDTIDMNKTKDVQHRVVLKCHYVLKYLCAYSSEADKDCFLRGEVESALPAVLKIIMDDGPEATMGLAVMIFRIGNPAKINQGFSDAGINERELAARLVFVLQQYSQPSVEVPRIRRYIISLAIEMMKFNMDNARTFISFGLTEELRKVARTTCDLECFNLFSGSVGLSRYSISVPQLVDIAMEMMASKQP